MEQEILNIIATAAAEFHALGDDEKSGMIMHAVESMVRSEGMQPEALHQANAVYRSLCDRAITDMPDKCSPDEAPKCIEAMRNCIRELNAEAASLFACSELLKDYWETINANRE